MEENRTTIVEKTVKSGSPLAAPWLWSQLYNMEIRWVGIFMVAQLGLCDIFYFTLLNFSSRNR